ncbi:DUF3089 domain-containing protein [Ralstonia insidiosa]|uniref:DUF3089 domain-containing protein n=2 Tax=Ralstonia insidiosa TaxID=190721 RepID=A0A848P347_9RALS|nr:DUF3089 domain-containing protein [Ralstonia insidiosa]
MNRMYIAACMFSASLGCAPLAQAQTSSSVTLTHNNYRDTSNWLCWPGAKPNACEADMRSTVINRDGSMAIEPFKANPDAPVDCFYVYPTVSHDPGELSDMKVKVEEQAVAREQAARFASKCRIFAPMYRQRTLAALKKSSSLTAQPPTSYSDVSDAWKYYLAHANHGRGVVLIGHSQGARMLKELIAREIDGKPAQALLVSAIVLGGNVTVAKGSDVGGDFKTVPLCRSADQIGCVIAYSSFPENSPPPEDSLFGRPNTPGENLEDACVNPANLAGGEGELHSYLASGVSSAPGDPRFTDAWVKGEQVTTPFVSVPGLMTARCVSAPPFNYLAIHVNGDPADTRTKQIHGDVVANGKALRQWGWHLIDVDLAQGNLLDIVDRQVAAWRKAAQ